MSVSGEGRGKENDKEGERMTVRSEDVRQSDERFLSPSPCSTRHLRSSVLSLRSSPPHVVTSGTREGRRERERETSDLRKLKNYQKLYH